MNKMGTRKIFSIVTLLNVLVCKLECVCVDCHLPPNAPEEEVERFVILDFKRRLMERLGLKTEPKIGPTAPLSIVNAISRSGLLAGDQGRETTEEPSKINDIVFGPSDFHITKNRYNFKFQVTSNLRGSYRLDGVKVWLYTNKDNSKRHWFQIYDRTRWGKKLLINDTIGVDMFRPYQDWTSFKLKPNKDWYRTPWKTLNLEFVGFDDSMLYVKDYQPRLEVRTRPVKKRLYKRSTKTTDCPKDPQDHSCCKHTMTLDLTGHIPWLITPTNIQALVCRGECPALHRSRWLWSFIAQVQHSRKPCCVPTKLSPISILHHNEKGEIIQAEVRDMIVASCGCS